MIRLYYITDSEKDELVAQIDLFLDKLIIKYVQSNWFRLDHSGTEIPNLYLLTAQLLSAMRPDSTLQLNNSFILSMTVLNLRFSNILPSGWTQGNFNVTAKLCNNLMNNDFLAPRSFFSTLKQGYVDLSLLDNTI